MNHDAASLLLHNMVYQLPFLPRVQLHFNEVWSVGKKFKRIQFICSPMAELHLFL